MTRLQVRMVGEITPYATFYARPSDTPGFLDIQRDNNEIVVIQASGSISEACCTFLNTYYGMHFNSGELEVMPDNVYEMVTYGQMRPATPSMAWMPGTIADIDAYRGEIARRDEIGPRDADGSALSLLDTTTSATPAITWTTDYPLDCAQPDPSHEPSPRTEEMPSVSTRRRRRYLTLMPYSSFVRTAHCLSTRDLRFMRVAALRVLRAYTVTPGGLNDFRRKAINLWVGRQGALARYGIAIAKEMESRGFENTSLEEFKAGQSNHSPHKPSWVFWPRLQGSHRSYLKLRGIRDNFVRRLHEQFIRDTCTMGVREYVQVHEHKNVRNMSFSDIAAISDSAVQNGHYNEEFGPNSAQEDYVYPSPVQC